MITSSNITQPLSSLSITLSVWRALFLREAITRLASGRAAWFWLLLEPAFHMAFMMFVFTVIRLRTVSGMDVVIWLLVGLLAMFMFMRTASQSKNAVNSNKALFAYRQVKPVDTVLTRAFLEAFLLIMIAALMISGIILIDVGQYPNDPFLLFIAFLGLWLTGLGYGLITSVIGDLVPEVDKILKFVMAPTYMLSGVIFPISSIPKPYQDWLLYNPIAHGVEAARASISIYYHPFQGLNIGYTYGCALTMIFIGLALHNRFAVQLVMK
jgi:capsular polysaccharide transport system permease protein